MTTTRTVMITTINTNTESNLEDRHSAEKNPTYPVSGRGWIHDKSTCEDPTDPTLAPSKSAMAAEPLFMYVDVAVLTLPLALRSSAWSSNTFSKRSEVSWVNSAFNMACGVTTLTTLLAGASLRGAPGRKDPSNGGSSRYFRMASMAWPKFWKAPVATSFRSSGGAAVPRSHCLVTRTRYCPSRCPMLPAHTSDCPVLSSQPWMVDRLIRFSGWDQHDQLPKRTSSASRFLWGLVRVQKHTEPLPCRIHFLRILGFIFWELQNVG